MFFSVPFKWNNWVTGCILISHSECHLNLCRLSCGYCCVPIDIAIFVRNTWYWGNLVRYNIIEAMLNNIRDHLGMGSANERRRYIATSPVIWWAHKQKDIWIWVNKSNKSPGIDDVNIHNITQHDEVCACLWYSLLEHRPSYDQPFCYGCKILIDITHPCVKCI